MALATAAVNLQLFLQKLVRTPCFLVCDPSNINIPSYASQEPFKSSKCSKTTWNIAKGFLVFQVLSCLIRILWVYQILSASLDLEQLGVYASFVATGVINTAAYKHLEKEENCYLTTQMFILIKFSDQRTIRKHNTRFYSLRNLVTLIMYLFAFSFTLFPFAFASLPFIRDYDPIQMFFKVVTPSHLYIPIVSQTLSSCCYFFYVSHGIIVNLSTFNLFLLFAEGVHKLSSKLLVQNFTFQLKTRQLYILRVFKSSMTLYRLVQMLVNLASLITRVFTGLLIGLGILIAAFCSCAVIKLYGSVPINVYITCFFTVILCFAINFMLILLASVPNRNAAKFVTQWKFWVGWSKRASMEIRACQSIGYSAGLIKILKPHTAVTIAETIVSVTVNFVLMASS